MRRRRNFKLLLVCAMILIAASAFLLGFVVNERKWPPYGTTIRIYEALRPIALRLQERVAPHRGRFREARFGTEQDDGLTAAQREELDALRAIAYVSGSVPARGASGVTVYDRQLAHDGINLQTDGHRAAARLFDMEGRELHRWELPFERAFPDSDVPPWAEGSKYWRRVRLLAHGELLAIYEGNGLIRLDRDSELIWAYPGWAHHDLDVLADGTIYVLTREAEIVPRINPQRPILHDYIVELDPAGRPRRRVSVLEALERSDYSGLVERLQDYGDLLHTNTLEVLDGSLASRLPAFAAGNILISIHTIDTIAVVDMDRQRIVWAMAGLWQAQHEPTVLDNGHLLIFDNRGDGGWSRILEFDPLTQSIRWSYDGSRYDFLSKTCGTAARLPNGNTLITESDNGRAFEVTPEHKIVWEYRTPNRAGEHQELVATLFDVIRIEHASIPVELLPRAKRSDSGTDSGTPESAPVRTD